MISLCWLPYAILLYPGVIWYDTEQQLLQWGGLPNVYTDGQLNDHHPIFDTMLYGLFMDAGRALGSADAGIFAFSLLQMLFTAGVVAVFLYSLGMLGASRRAQRFVGVLLCAFPPVPIWACAVAKDSTNLPFLLTFILLLFIGPVTISNGIPQRRLSVLHPKAWTAALTCCACFITLTKKTGAIFIIFVTIMYLARWIRHEIYMRRPIRAQRQCHIAHVQQQCSEQKQSGAATHISGERTIISTLICATVCSLSLTCLIMPLIVLPLFHVTPGGKQELLGQAFQQAALTLNKHGESMSDADRQAFTDMLGREATVRYAYWTVDSVKGDTWSPQQEQALPAFLKAWVSEGIRHPITYMQSYLAVEQGWFAFPHSSDSDHNAYLTPTPTHMVTRHFEGAGQLGLTFNDGRIAGVMEDTISWFQESPIGMLTSSKALWSTWTLIFLIEESRRYRAAMKTLIPLIAWNAILWLSPVTTTDETMRYLMPVFFLVPLTFAMLTTREASTA
ncbi:DUF6020 family protein [Bifidobacterium scaligerum]|uniref:Glycosyltransferase RgtA/B/C/D-like domain-containing protein n=1 Tax=Bifidobacterium scaligerum TaxID=2052656 RepID=A0A2M9HPT9_9BIFI|nr:DUF6020 family protein [Bifidobacterium scaligerum]PJM78826.1 hypothetical protein CUU80_07635 [Bifidobacterium scaligerum]